MGVKGCSGQLMENKDLLDQKRTSLSKMSLIRISCLNKNLSGCTAEYKRIHHSMTFLLIAISSSVLVDDSGPPSLSPPPKKIVENIEDKRTN